MTDDAGAKRGPKRSEQSRLAILTAAYELTSESGYGQLTIEGIAARAGVGKQTVYRWWSHKADVLLEALALKANLRVSTTDHGSYRADLRRFLADSFDLLAADGIAPALRALMAEAQLSSEFRARLRPFLDGRRVALREIVDRARTRGDYPRGQHPDITLDLVFGFVWYRVLASDRLPSRRDVPRVLAQLGVD